MPIDYKSFKKLETQPPSAQAEALEGQRLLVLVKVRAPDAAPSYVTPRAQIGPTMFSAEVSAVDLKKLEADPAVESVSISRRLPLIK
jgi:hypothetical protein